MPGQLSTSACRLYGPSALPRRAARELPRVPVLHTLADASEELARAATLADFAARAGVKTMVAFNNIKTPAALLARQLIERGDIGTPMRFRGWFE
jgi:hypothetical protein